MGMQNPVCGKCGDRGYEETLVCCFMCHDAYEHRYCFNKASDIFRKNVKWSCEDCLSTSPKKPSPKKIGSSPTRRSERIRTRSNLGLDASPAAKPVGEISPPSAKRAKKNYGSSNEAKCTELPNTKGSMKSNEKLGCVLEKNGNKDTQASSELLKETLSNPEEAKSYSGGTLSTDLPGSPPLYDNLSLRCNLQAQPIMDPVWKGSFRICYKKPIRVEGVSAHLSTLACPKAQQAASLLPVALHPRIVPRSSVWPKSFQNAEPKDESIGLYFFPERDRDAEAFDSLVNIMIVDDLAMICVVKNAELLVFTSINLPCDNWRFQGKRYLWGVFRAKQTLPSSHSKQ